MRWTFVGSSFALMFLAAYLDNARGPLLPVLSHTLKLPYGATSGLFIAGNIAAFVAILSLIPLTRRFGERRLAIGSGSLALAIPLFAAAVTGLPSLLLFGGFLGTMISLFGALSNVLVVQGSDEQRRARFFCGLHMLYGFGSLVAPAIVGALMARGAPWHATFWLPLLPTLALVVFFVTAFRVKAGDEGVIIDEPAPFEAAHWLAIGIMCVYVIGETLASTWMVAFLVDGRALTVTAAAPYLSGFFLVMGATRALCFLVLKPSQERIALWLSLLLPAAALAVAHRGFLWALPIAGCCGPFFPVMMARISRAFPRQSRPLMLASLAWMQISLAAGQCVMGAIADRSGVAVAYRVPIVVLLLVGLGVWLWRRYEGPRLAVSESV